MSAKPYQTKIVATTRVFFTDLAVDQVAAEVAAAIANSQLVGMHPDHCNVTSQVWVNPQHIVEIL